MATALLGVLIGLLIGAACRVLDIPLPAPPKLTGALLVMAMTIGYVASAAILKST
jgi:XapX domain-containing protein